jgi:hypothetical protein
MDNWVTTFSVRSVSKLHKQSLGAGYIYKLQTCPIVREGVPHQHTGNSLTNEHPVVALYMGA